MVILPRWLAGSNKLGGMLLFLSAAATAFYTVVSVWSHTNGSTTVVSFFPCFQSMYQAERVMRVVVLAEEGNKKVKYVPTFSKCDEDDGEDVGSGGGSLYARTRIVFSLTGSVVG